VSRIPGAISIPAKAIHAPGKPTVFVVEKGKSRPVGVKVEARNPDEVAVSGLAARGGAGGRGRKERKQKKPDSPRSRACASCCWPRRDGERSADPGGCFHQEPDRIAARHAWRGQVTVTVAARGEPRTRSGCWSRP
jgi:hypothetical protein